MLIRSCFPGGCGRLQFAVGAFRASFATARPSSSSVVHDGDDPLDGMTAETRSLADALVRGMNTSNNNSSWNNDDAGWTHRSAVSQAITLVESRSEPKQEQAGLLLTYLLRCRRQNTTESFRIGIAGSPGAGKSTFIEALGQYVLDDQSSSTAESSSIAQSDNNKNHPILLWHPKSLAVVCIDPSSLRTGGSILGDKTRMTQLSADPRAFVRPAANSGVLGGLAPRTDDVLRLLSQQYPLTLLETVGLGQSEVEVQQSVDMLILAVPPGGGDDLQGVKKGIVEVADMIVVTKADGDLLSTAKHTAADYRGAMSFLNSITAHLQDDDDDCSASSSSACTQHALPTKVLLASAVTRDGLDEVWEHICTFRQEQLSSGRLAKRRREQGRYWIWRNFQSVLQEQTERDPILRQAANELLQKLDDGSIPPRVAATLLFRQLQQQQQKE